MTDSRVEEPGVRQWARLAWRRKWLLLAIVVATPVLVFAGSSLLPKTYEAKATVNVRQTVLPSAVFSNQISAGSNIGEVRTLIRTTLVARRAARLLGEPPSEARSLLDQVTVDPTNPAEALENGEGGGGLSDDHRLLLGSGARAEIANAFARATAQARSVKATRDINTMLNTLETQATRGTNAASQEALAQQLQQLRGLRAGQIGTTPLVEAAVPPKSPSSPRPGRNAALAFILALIAAAALAPLLDKLDRKVREPEEMEDLLEAPLLTTIPDDAFPGHIPGPHVLEAFETLRASLTYFNVDRPLSSLVVGSAAQQDGKTTVAINLAIAYARDGRNVILVDGDLRVPQVAKRLGKEVSFGLDSVLVGERALGESLVDVDAGGGGRLRILPGANPPPNPAVLLGSMRMRSLLAELTEMSDIVVIDSPALLAVSDAIPLINEAAGTILVARLNRTPKEALRRMSQLVGKAGGSVLGCVATGAQKSGAYGYYGPYDNHDRDKDGQNEEKEALAGSGSGNGSRNGRRFVDSPSLALGDDGTLPEPVGGKVAASGEEPKQDPGD